MEMAKNYFVVLELPGGEELKFVDGKCSPKYFWENAANAVFSGNASIIISREDTGVCEEFRKHVATIKKFTTFILVNLCLCSNDTINHTEIYKKFTEISQKPYTEVIIDADHNFQLVAIDV